VGNTSEQERTHPVKVQKVKINQVSSIIPGAERLAKYVPLLQNKKVGLVVNHTSRIQNKHVLDSLLELDIDVQKVFAPEHGFRGEEDAGAKIKDGKDPKTGVSIISLYGAKRAPSEADLADLDILVYDIQDVGVRFYTFISTMHHVMQACADYGKPLVVLDRPNPNGHYVDGPVLDLKFQSFVGMHPIPVVYGLTCGELAHMINGEGWLKDGAKCNLTVIPCLNYAHSMSYDLPVKPSPNLPNLRSVLLYPSLCFFEPTIVSIGRGTQEQFQIIGHPDYGIGSYYFTPKPQPGAQNPKLKGIQCNGQSLTGLDPAQIKDWGQLDFSYLMKFYQRLKDEHTFITSPQFFDKLAGSDQLRKQLLAGYTVEQIKSSWAAKLDDYKEKRRKYLIYDL
jgi:uncharacterized protein YbbC (DUF1343 family)